jgi:hypothetical protein
METLNTLSAAAHQKKLRNVSSRVFSGMVWHNNMRGKKKSLVRSTRGGKIFILFAYLKFKN